MNLPEIKVYRIQKRRKATSYFYLFLLALMVLSLAAFAIQTIISDALTGLFVYIPAISFFAFGIYNRIAEITGVLEIQNDRLVYRSMFKERVIQFSEIEGYTAQYERYSAGNKVINFVLKSKEQSGITVSPFMEHNEELLRWLSVNFTDLEAAELKENTKILLENPEFGASQEKRKSSLSNAKYVAWSLNLLGTVSGLWILFFSFPPTMLIIFAVAFPFLMGMAVYLSKGLIHYYSGNRDPNPSLGVGFVCSSIGLCMRALIDYNLVGYGQLWLRALIIAIGLGLILIALTPEFKYRGSLQVGNIIGMLLFLLVYSFGAYIFSNCLLDNRPSQAISTTAKEKRISHSQIGDVYYVRVKSAGPITDTEIAVSEKTYKNIVTESNVQVEFKPGRWGTTWYYVVKGD
jgi:hypothetical protein